MSRGVGEASAILPSINSPETDLGIYRALQPVSLTVYITIVYIFVLLGKCFYSEYLMQFLYYLMKGKFEQFHVQFYK